MTTHKPLWLKAQVVTELYRHHVLLEQCMTQTTSTIASDCKGRLLPSERQRLYDLYHALRMQDWLMTEDNAELIAYEPSDTFLQLRELNASMTPSLAAMLGMYLLLGLDAPDKKVVDMPDKCCIMSYL